MELLVAAMESFFCCRVLLLRSGTRVIICTASLPTSSLSWHRFASLTLQGLTVEPKVAVLVRPIFLRQLEANTKLRCPVPPEKYVRSMQARVDEPVAALPAFLLQVLKGLNDLRSASAEIEWVAHLSYLA